MTTINRTAQDRIVLARVLKRAMDQKMIARQYAVQGDSHSAAIMELRANQKFNAIKRQNILLSESANNSTAQPIRLTTVQFTAIV